MANRERALICVRGKNIRARKRTKWSREATDGVVETTCIIIMQIIQRSECRVRRDVEPQWYFHVIATIIFIYVIA